MARSLEIGSVGRWRVNTCPPGILDISLLAVEMEKADHGGPVVEAGIGVPNKDVGKGRVYALAAYEAGLLVVIPGVAVIEICNVHAYHYMSWRQRRHLAFRNGGFQCDWSLY